LLDIFADVFSRYWFVFVLLLLAGGAAATSDQPGLRRQVARVLAYGAAIFVLLGVFGLLLR
jgi:hypothetical protein